MPKKIDFGQVLVHGVELKKYTDFEINFIDKIKKTRVLQMYLKKENPIEPFLAELCH